MNLNWSPELYWIAWNWLRFKRREFSGIEVEWKWNYFDWKFLITWNKFRDLFQVIKLVNAWFIKWMGFFLYLCIMTATSRSDLICSLHFIFVIAVNKLKQDLVKALEARSGSQEEQLSLVQKSSEINTELIGVQGKLKEEEQRKNVLESECSGLKVRNVYH